jgi:hypothetical protein
MTALLPKRLRLFIVLCVGTLESRAVENHFGDEVARDAVVDLGEYPIRLGAFALAERDDLALQFVGMIDEQRPLDQLDLLACK